MSMWTGFQNGRRAGVMDMDSGHVTNIVFIAMLIILCSTMDYRLVGSYGTVFIMHRFTANTTVQFSG